MGHIILIQAHEDVARLNRLIAALEAPRFKIYVHLDRKSAIVPSQLHPAARAIAQRLDVAWGGFSLVAATLQSLREITAAELEFGHLACISGADFPVVSNEELVRSLDASPAAEYISHTPIGPQGWDCGSRLERFHFEAATPPDLTIRAVRLLYRALGLKLS